MPPIGRRTLLGIPAAAALAGCTSPAAPPTPSARDVPSAASARDETASIVVVGAGMAGLACARTLTDQGHRVVVLEARDRIGGRIVTSRTWDKIPIDLGASWIHGTTKNPIAALASTIGARTLATSYDSGQVYIEKTLQDAGLTTPHTDRWEALATRASDLAARSASDLSVADAVKAVAPKGLSEAESSDLAFYLTGTYASEWGQSAAHLSARMMDAGEEFSGPDVLLPDGYDAIPRSLAQGLDVRLGRAVHAITHRPEGVTLETSAGRLDAKAVVVTVPLGVLKSGAIVFDPPLPAASQSAIGALSMGVLGKTFLKFDHVFWPAHIDWHEWLSRSNVWTEWVSFAKADMPVLLGFTVDDDARRIEAASERQVVDEAMVAIRGMFGPDAPTPVAMQRSNWAADPYALGSYSGYGVGSTRGHRVALAQGQSQRLFLAGEATEPDYFGTAHGAYLSGLRAAKQASSMLS